MEVFVYDYENDKENYSYKYNAPAGLKLPEYLSSLHPDKTLEISFTPNSKKLITEKWRNNIKIRIIKNQKCLEMHIGEYQNI